VGPTDNIILDTNCEISRIPLADDDRHKKHLVRVSRPPIEGVFRPFVHCDCLCNQIRSIVGRVAGPVPKPSDFGVELLYKASERIKDALPRTTANDIHAMPMRYSGNKRRRYEFAVDRFLMGGVHRTDAYCKMFVKAERIDGESKVNPDPRAIQFRGAVYCVALGSYLHPIEHELYLYDGASDGVPKSRNIAKGLNSVDRARLLNQKLSHFVSPRIVGLDASRWDKHVAKVLLQLEHSIYLHSNPCRFFAYLLSLQLNNTVFSSLGIKYKVEGRRMSGDMNTALGNCLLMLIMLIACSMHLKIQRWDCLDDGDDCLVIVEASDVSTFCDAVEGIFLHFGMEMKVDPPVDSLHKIVFCQSNVIEHSPGDFKFVRHFRNVASKAMSGIRHWDDSTYRTRVLSAIGTCELVLNLGVPILQEFSLALLRNTGIDVDVLQYAPDGIRARASRDLKALGLTFSEVKPRPIQDCARSSFELAFGVSPNEQIDMERALRGWSFDCSSPNIYWGSERDVPTWLPNYSNYDC